MKYINLFLFALMITMNYLANALPLNNKTTGELSDSLPNLFVPAGITFSIWGVIYLLLLIYCIIQFTSPDQEVISGITIFFGITCLLNASWIVFWHYCRIPASLIVMAGLLVSLIWINIFIRILPYGIIKAVFGIYLGWICIAAIANVTALLVSINWNGSGISGQTWTIIMIAAGALIAIMSIYRFNNPFIGISVVWAFLGIMIKRQDDFRAIFITALIALVVVAVVTVAGFLRRQV